jgi:hypothetical protein
MTFDKPEHQQIVKQLIDQAQFPGHLLELALELKQAVATGTQVAAENLASGGK